VSTLERCSPPWVPDYARESAYPAKTVAGEHFSQAESLNSAWEDPLSSWSRSASRRAFDFLCVLCSLPVFVPVFLVVGLAVLLTSAGPVLFLQKRVGRHGRLFTILKFRTMKHDCGTPHQAVTTAGNQRFTPIGIFLRRWKLDELPQLWNVLVGQMSLVGPRPKLPEHEPCCLPCRPGITGAATVVFACEERELDRIPRHALDDYYNNIVLPAKRKLDVQYMAQATFRSDLELLVNTVLRRWGTNTMRKLLREEPQVALGWDRWSQFRAREASIPPPFVLHIHERFAAEEEPGD